MSDTLNTTFGGTVLYDPITEVLNCLVGLKIAGIEKGLAWVSDNAHVDFPSLPNNTFSLGAVASLSDGSANQTDSFLANPSSETTDLITSAVVSLTDKVADAIQTEAIVATCVVLVWVTVVLIGLIRTLILFFGRDRTRGEGGTSYGCQRPGTIPEIREDPGLPAYGARTTIDDAWDKVPMDEANGGKLGFAGERTGAVLDQGLPRTSSCGIVDAKS